MIFIAVPTYDGAPLAPQRDSIHKLRVAMKERGETSLYYEARECSFIPWARDLAVHNFMKSDFAKLLFVDDDISFEPETIFAMRDANEPVVGVSCPKKVHNWENVKGAAMARLNIPLARAAADFVFNPDRGQPNPYALDAKGLLTAKSVGTGLVMIRRHVFEDLAPFVKTYRNGSNPQLLGETIRAYFPTGIRHDPDDGFDHYDSEDYGFCTLWRAHGGKIKILPNATVGHTGLCTYEGNLAQTLAIEGKVRMPQ
jgi:hypothetical protein